MVPVHHLPGGTRGTRTSEAPDLHGHGCFFPLLPTLGPSTYSTNPSRSAYRPARMLPLLIRAAAARAGLFGIPVVLCWSPGGESSHIPLEPICIHSLSTCTFPVQVIIYIKHYLYSCIFSIRKRVMSTRTSKRLTHFTCVEKTKVKQVVRIIAAVLKRHSSKSLIPSSASRNIYLVIYDKAALLLP